MRSLSLRHYFTAALVVAVVLPASSFAGVYFHLGFGFGCTGCYRPPMQCACPAPAPICPPAAPVLQQSFVPQQCVSYEDVPRIEYRRQAYTEQVPVTTYEQVAETVYVPQQVMRSVPRTVMTQQTRYRDVAFQTTERIARPHTQMVPQTTIGFRPVSAPGGCSSCGETNIGLGPAGIPQYHSVLPAAAPTIMAPSITSPAHGAIPSMPPISISPYDHSHTVPQYDDVNWSTVQPRIAPMPSRTGVPVRGASLFRPAPTAATVWQSRF